MKTLLDLFRRVPIISKIRDDHHQARLDLLQAEAQKEYYDAIVPMLRQRVSRLERGMEADDIANNITRLNRQKGVANV